MILIVDDDASVTASLGLLLKQAGYQTHAVAAPAQAEAWLAAGHPCALVLQDMNFSRQTSGEEGLSLLARIRALRPALPVVLKGDADAQYDKVMQALEICKRLDIVDIGLVTKRAGG